jgi:hypothetical protein
MKCLCCNKSIPDDIKYKLCRECFAERKKIILAIPNCEFCNLCPPSINSKLCYPCTLMYMKQHDKTEIKPKKECLEKSLARYIGNTEGPIVGTQTYRVRHKCTGEEKIIQI